MSNLLEALVLGIADGFAPYALAAAALLATGFVWLRDDQLARRIFMATFILVVLILSFSALEGFGHRFIYRQISKQSSFCAAVIICGWLVFCAGLLVRSWVQLRLFRAATRSAIPFFPGTRIRSLLALISGVGLALIWFLAAFVWPPSFQVTITAMNSILPGKEFDSNILLLSYSFFRVVPLIGAALCAEYLLFFLKRGGAFERYRSLILVAVSAYLIAVGLGVFILLVKRG